jgi:hypothetical protein
MAANRTAELSRDYSDVDRWVNNTFIQTPAARPSRPKARWVKRRPVSLRAMHRITPDPVFGFDPPECVDPAWSIAQTIAYWEARL